MTEILLILYVLTVLMQYLIFADIILSWLNLRISFIKNILDPIYEKITHIIPTSIGPFDFSGIVLILILAFIQGLIGAYDNNIIILFKNLTTF